MSPISAERAERADALIIGAGISGLTTAFHLTRAGLRVTVLEASSRVGGAIQTLADGPWRFELGPSTVLENNESIGRLIHDAGLDGEKLTALPSAKRRFLWKGDRLHALPGGPGGFVTTPLFPVSAKLRLLREPWIRRPAGDPEETIAQFVRRRLGQAFLDYAVGPFVSGVYAGDAERLSVRWAVPKIYALERDHGSLIRGAMARRKGPSPGGAMISFREGLEELPRRLAAMIRDLGDVRTGVACERLIRTGAGFRAETSAGAFEAERIVLAVPADVAARLLDEATGGESRPLAEIPYAAVAVVALGCRRADIAHPLGGFGFLAPRKEGLRVLGCLFPSEIFPNRAPEGHVALSAFVGGRTDPEIAGWDEDRIVSAVESDLRRALGLSGTPVFRVVRRWPRAIPQYELGHGRYLDLARRLETNLPGLRLGGNYLGGVSVPDCIKNGTALAEEILAERKG